MLINIDFHIHSKYSGGTSKNMKLDVIAEQAQLKGLDIVGTGDALNPGWMHSIKNELKETSQGSGIYEGTGGKERTRFLITAEVEDARRVHHLLIFPGIEAAESLYDRLKKYSRDIDKDGRPHLRLDAENLVDYVVDTGSMIGPCHAFTPWTSLYKEYNSITECYGSNLDKIKFLELGLSADTGMADRISELKDLTFMTNSDTHSPWPHRLGREFNRVSVDCSFSDINFTEIKNSIINHKFNLNAGLNPREGKYHLTACTRCFLRFRYNDAVRCRWRCPVCRGTIKKGVADRVNELAQSENPEHPPHRPPYIHILPLAEIISLECGIHTLNSKKVMQRWNEIISGLGNEINILIDADTRDISKIDPKIGKIIEKFRTGRIRYIAGGGGEYGKPVLCGEAHDNYWGQGQKTLEDF